MNKSCKSCGHRQKPFWYCTRIGNIYLLHRIVFIILGCKEYWNPDGWKPIEV